VRDGGNRHAGTHHPHFCSESHTNSSPKKMGKKSRRSNWNKPKDIPVVALPAVAAPRQVITSAADDVATFNQLYKSQDWEGLLELESKMIALTNRMESLDPRAAGSINFMLGRAHQELGREGGIEQASLYYQKAIEMAKKAGNNDILTKGVICLSQCYVEMGRVDEAMDLHKSLCDEIGKESLNPDDILRFADILEKNHDHSRAITILEEHLGAIESSWEKQKQCRAYEMIARIYSDKNDFAKSNVYYERQLSIAKETKNVESEASALHSLGHNYGRTGEYGNAMAYLEQALLIESERGDDKIGVIYCAMGDVLVAQEGREKEGILMFQKCAELFEEGDTSEERIWALLKLGHAYTTIEAWDDAIASQEECISNADSIIEDERLGNQFKASAKQSLGNTYLAKYESLPERNDELISKALFWSEAAFNLQNSKEAEGVNHALFLDLAQEHYFLGDAEKAHLMLKEYLEATVKLGPSHCQSCCQICAKDAIMEKCSVCKVARYCSQAHSMQAWQKGRLCHKVMCPHLKRWRKIKPDKETTTDLRHALYSDFFERVLASKPK